MAQLDTTAIATIEQSRFMDLRVHLHLQWDCCFCQSTVTVVLGLRLGLGPLMSAITSMLSINHRYGSDSVRGWSHRTWNFRLIQ